MEPTDFVTVAILAKDKAHLMPLYLNRIEQQTYPAEKIKLYIRTNNNKDNTADILENWIARVRDRYSEIYYDNSDVNEPVHEYGPHEWNQLRLKVLGHIRQDSVAWARERGTHYFIADCDNFIIPETIDAMLATGLPVVGPLLRNEDDCFSNYANYHFAVDDQGYYKDVPQYYEVLRRNIKGLIQVGVIHCTYLIRREHLEDVCYDDGSGRYEYVIFSETLRKKGIPQYIDNRRYYGKLTFAETAEDFQRINMTPPPAWRRENL